MLYKFTVTTTRILAFTIPTITTVVTAATFATIMIAVRVTITIPITITITITIIITITLQSLSGVEMYLDGHFVSAMGGAVERSESSLVTKVEVGSTVD